MRVRPCCWSRFAGHCEVEDQEGWCLSKGNLEERNAERTWEEIPARPGLIMIRLGSGSLSLSQKTMSTVWLVSSLRLAARGIKAWSSTNRGSVARTVLAAAKESNRKG